MLRILVADDERVTRRGLVAMLQRDLKEEVEWMEAENGAQALKLVQQRPVDLVLTDICMPLCSGLEFVEQLRQSQQAMTVIIISGYANFEYAKQAVRLGVRDYILKPVNKEELLGLVERCIADIQKKRQDTEAQALQQLELERMVDHLQQDALRRLLTGERAEACPKTLEAAGFMPDALFFKCAVVEYECPLNGDPLFDRAVRGLVDDYLSQQQMQAITATVTCHRGCLAILLTGSVTKNLVAQRKLLTGVVLRVECLCASRTVCGVGGTVHTADQIFVSYQQGSRAADLKLYGTREYLMFWSEGQEQQNTPLISQSLLEYWDMGCETKIMRAFEDCAAQPQALHYVQQMRLSYDLLYQAVERSMRNLPLEERPVFCQFSSFWSIFELRREVEALLQQLNAAAGEDADDSSSGVAREIVRYTIDHITEDIDLNHLADRFGKTPGYVGKLFRKGSQMGFNEFVTGERIKLAKRLLLDPGMTVQQVGGLCGYYNPKYFSTTFKKITGMSPKVYREQER